MRRFVGRAVLIALVIGAGTLPAMPAMADCGINTGHFCAYKGSQFNNRILHSSAPAGTDNVDVADDVVSSGKNGTNNHWCGMTNVILLPPDLVFDFAPHTAVEYVGDGANDRIDWFKVRSSSC